MGHRTREQVTRDCWWTRQTLGPEHKLPERAGLPRGPSDHGPSLQGEPVDPAHYRSRAQVARDSWSTPRALGPERESSGRVGRLRGSSDMAPSRPGELFDTACSGTWPQVPRDMWSSPRAIGAGSESSGTVGRPWRPSGPSRIAWENWSTTRAFRHEHESLGRAGRHRGPLDRGPSHPPELVDPAGYRSRVRVTRESWSTPRALGTGP